MLNLPYAFIEAKNEKELFEKLTKLAVGSGFTFKIINVYPKGKNKVIAWYYASKRTQ